MAAKRPPALDRVVAGILEGLPDELQPHLHDVVERARHDLRLPQTDHEEDDGYDERDGQQEEDEVVAAVNRTDVDLRAPAAPHEVLRGRLLERSAEDRREHGPHVHLAASLLARRGPWLDICNSCPKPPATSFISYARRRIVAGITVRPKASGENQFSRLRANMMATITPKRSTNPPITAAE